MSKAFDKSKNSATQWSLSIAVMSFRTFIVAVTVLWAVQGLREAGGDSQALWEAGGDSRAA